MTPTRPLKPNSCQVGRRWTIFTAALAATLCLGVIGCVKPLAEHTTALSAATAPVVDQATAAYQAANSIHNMAEDYDAVSDFDKTAPVYNPRDVQPLLSDAQLDARLAVLKALQLYVQTLVAVTNGTESPALDAASKSVGNSLTALTNTEAPRIDSALGIAAPTASTTETNVTTTAGVTTTSTSTSIAAGVTVSPKMKDILTAGVDALSQYLVNRKVKEELPSILEKMDPQVKALCELLTSEIDILSSQETIDFNSVINRQTLFLRTATLSAEERREGIMKLPDLGRRQRAAVQQLVQLRAALVKLELTHHALAAEAQGNNPESLKARLGDLEAAGSNLGKFYSSLSTAK